MKKIFREHEVLPCLGLYTHTNLLVSLQDNQARITRTHNTMSMKVPNLKTAMGRKSFAFRGPVHWNSLPGNLKLINKLNPFVTELKKRETCILDNHPE